MLEVERNLVSMVDGKITIIQDTRNKEGKPIRVAFEKGAVENGVIVHAQALDFGDYCLLTRDIQKLFDEAAENRIRDLQSDSAFMDLDARLEPWIPDSHCRHGATYTYLQFMSDRTSLISGRLNAVAKSDLSGLFPRAVETKWHLSELDRCIDTFEFKNELEKAKRNNCYLLVLVVTDRYDDFCASRIAKYKAKLGALGAWLDICTVDETFKKIYEFLVASHYHFALNDHTKNGFIY